MLAEAQSVFSPYDAPIKAIPNICNAKDLSPAKIAVVYLSQSAPSDDHSAFLDCFKSPKVELLVLYMPHHSSTLAFRWGQAIGKRRVKRTDLALNVRHLRQILRSKNVVGTALAQQNAESFADIRKRLGLTQEQFAQSLHVAPRTVQNWESGFGTSQMPKKTKDIRQLLSLMDEYVLAPHEQEWLKTPLPAVQNLTPLQAIQQGRTRDLVVEFLRLAEGQPI